MEETRHLRRFVFQLFLCWFRLFIHSLATREVRFAVHFQVCQSFCVTVVRMLLVV